MARPTVQRRWKSPKDAKFLAVPEASLRVLADRATPTEERIMLRIIAGWRWDAGTLQPVSASHLAEVCGLSRRTVRRAIEALVDKQIIDKWERGHGLSPEVGIEPLIRLSRRREDGAKPHRLTKPRAVKKGKPTSEQVGAILRKLDGQKMAPKCAPDGAKVRRSDPPKMAQS